MKLSSALRIAQRVIDKYKPISVPPLRITTLKSNGKKRKKDKRFAKENPSCLLVFLNGKTGELPPEVKGKDSDIGPLLLNP